MRATDHCPTDLDFDGAARLFAALDLAGVRAFVHTRFPTAPVPGFSGPLVRIEAAGPDVLLLELANLRRVIVDRGMFRGAGRVRYEGADAFVVVQAATLVYVL